MRVCSVRPDIFNRRRIVSCYAALTRADTIGALIHVNELSRRGWITRRVLTSLAAGWIKTLSVPRWRGRRGRAKSILLLWNRFNRSACFGADENVARRGFEASPNVEIRRDLIVSRFNFNLPLSRAS